MPPCCLGRFAPPVPALRPLSLAAHPPAGCTRLCPAESLPSARRPAFCAHHGRGKLLASARADFSLAQALASRKHLSPARWRPNQKPFGRWKPLAAFANLSRLNQAVAPNGGLCRTLNPRLEGHPALKSPGLTLTSACRRPTLASPRHREQRQLGQQPHLRLQSAIRFKLPVAQPASPRSAKPFWLRSPLTACSLSPAACGFTAGLSASPLPRPTMASAARRDRPPPPTARIFPNFCRHGILGAQPRPLHAGLGSCLTLRLL